MGRDADRTAFALGASSRWHNPFRGKRAFNDAIEVAAIRAELGDPPIGASKSAFGHAMAAAGALEVVATLLCFTHGQCAPTLNLDAVDPECAADHVTVARAFHGDAALKNSFGFGGQNATVIVGGAP